MPIIRRLTLSLLAVVSIVVVLFTWMQTQNEKSRLLGEMDYRALVLGESLADRLTASLAKPDLETRLQKMVGGGQHRNLRAAAVYDAEGNLMARAGDVNAIGPRFPALAKTVLDTTTPLKDIEKIGSALVHVQAVPIQQDGTLRGALLLTHDASFINRGLREMWKDGVIRILTLAALIILTTLLIGRWSVLRPIQKTAEWVKKLRLNSDDIDWSEAPHKEILGPLAREVKFLAQSLFEARAAAEEEAKLRQASESQWTAERLKEHVKTTLDGRPLFVVANREPYVHTRVGKEVKAIVPASGLVTALEPILKACGGMWIGHGSGDADRETVDSDDRLRVPPEDPLYSLRRVWITREEELGYYYGFSNEGLWPLCHIAHTRPVFRADDWEQYRKINERFAEVALAEMETAEEPCVLAQDYHFALLPRLIKKRRPDARVALFWHIPWPNPESFGICPWQREIIDGMLGADLLGFHIQYHCNNFLETVDRSMESRIDWAQFSVTRENHRTLVRPFPISVAGGGSPLARPKTNGDSPDKEAVLRQLGVKSRFIGVGVDRIDYTKGILERFRAVDRFLEKYPKYQSQFTFVELGAPSRTLIGTYSALDAEIEAEANRINWKFKNRDWKPIVLLKEHHSHKEIEKFYRISDLCMVTSLHDGMNLVAKEFIAANEYQNGVLILSRFTGAAQELRDALIVNPYDTEQMADAIHGALEMDDREKRKRMMRMQEVVRDNNIYRWGADLISVLAQIRLDPWHSFRKST